MPLFSYTAVSRDGKRASGSKEAVSVSELAKILRLEGFILTSSKSPQKLDSAGRVAKKIFGAVNIFSGVPLVEKMMFSRHLAVMVKAGFSLNKALVVLIAQTKNKHFAKIIGSIEEDIRKGVSFGDALAKYPNIFSDLFINMVRVGESSGGLEENLRLLAVQMKKDNDLRSKVKSAMMYPTVILVAMLGIGMGMMIFVMPKLVSVFSEMKAELPLPTKIVIGFSNFLNSHLLAFFLILISVIVSARVFLRTSRGKATLDKTILVLPIFGNISRKINCARMARTFSSLIESGISIVKTLEITSGTLTNVFFQRSLLEVSMEVQKGGSLSKALSKFDKLYPPIVIQMIQVGEETGTLGDINKRLAQFYEEEVSNVTKGLTSIIEPVLMVLMGVAVGFFAISMIQPMYSMMNNV